MEKTFDAFIEEKIAGDTDFQDSLKDLPDEEKNNLIDAKKVELLKSEAPTWFDNSNKNEKAYKDTKTRAEVAEAELKKFKPNETKKEDSGFTIKDTLALGKANIHEDDIEEVLEYAKFKGISVADALKNPVVTATLSNKEELRKTANATIIRSSRSTTTKTDGASIISAVKAGKGEDAIPASGSADASALFWARRGKKQPD